MELAITRDKKRLEELETIIDRTQHSFVECGCALKEIQTDRLYEKVRGVASFETYIRDRFGMARRTAYQLIDASKVIENVRNCGQVEVLPATESQARPLTRLKDDPEKQRVAWQKAVETAPEGKVTAAHVRKVVREMVEPPAPRIREQDKIVGPSDAMDIATFAISHLERIRKDDPQHDEAMEYVAAWIAKQKGGNKR